MGKTKTKTKPKAKTKTGARSAKSKTASKSRAGSRSSKSKSGAKAGSATVTVDRRRTSSDRRTSERRTKSEPVATDRRKLQRREKVQRRRQIDPTTCERDYTDAEVEFMNALDAYKRSSGRMFPTCSEILEVIRGLGYVQTDRPPAPAVEPVAESTAEQEPQAVA